MPFFLFGKQMYEILFIVARREALLFCKKVIKKLSLFFVLGWATVFHGTATTTATTTALASFLVLSHLTYNKHNYNCKD